MILRPVVVDVVHAAEFNYQRKEERKKGKKKKKKRLTIEERERESVCFGLCEFFFQLNIRL